MRQVLRILVVTASSVLVLVAQEKTGAREMYFGGLEAAAPPAAVKKAVATRPATKPATAAAAASQRNPPSSNRDLSGPSTRVPAINAVRTPLGLRYAVLKVNGAESVEVAPSTRFKSGDRIQLKIQTNSDGYLYVIAQGSSGAWQVMFPAKSKNDGSNRVQAGEEHTSSFRFDAKPGVEKLFVVLSRQPERDLDTVIYNLKGGAAPTPAAAQPEPVMLAGNLSVNDPLVARMRNSYTRDLVLEEVAAPERAERAIYVVNKTTGPDSRVVADIKLTHE
ncbi:MAG: DUF4384 domain-containing protein [Burkholderiales bacterium]